MFIDGIEIMLRQVNVKQVERIIRGEDLEYRILRYAVNFKQSIVLEGVHISRELSFQDSSLNEVVFKNCTFTADFHLTETRCSSLVFDSCQLNNISLHESVIDILTVKSSKYLQRFSLSDSSINELNISGNSIFETIDVGCGNNVVSAMISKNGSKNEGKDSTIYLCPERFDSILLKGNSSKTFHVGTVGNHSTFKIEDCKADLLLFSNCNGDDAEVLINNLRPINSKDSAIYLVNSKKIEPIEKRGVFSAFQNIKRYDQLTDELLSQHLS